MSDSIYRSAVQFTKFFGKGWGSPQILEKLFELQSRTAVDEKFFLSKVDKPARDVAVRILSRKKDGALHVIDGEFVSPFCEILPGALPPESQMARFQMILPSKWLRRKPIVIHYAGTGDHYFWRRRVFMASPLAKENGIASIILENPFYGSRKPKDQVRSGLNHVLDIFLMGGALAAETVTLLSWCEKQGLGPFGLTGISMGGHMATVCSTAWRSPIAVIPCLSWSTAAPVFTKGVMSKSVAWDVLEDQLNSYPEYEKILKSYCNSFLSSHPLGKIDNFFSLMPDQSVSDRRFQGADEEDALSDKNIGSDAMDTEQAISHKQINLLYNENKEFDSNRDKLNMLALDSYVFSGIESTYNNVLNFVQEKVNVDSLREKLTFVDKETRPTNPRTKLCMDAFMDTATHLRHFHKPCPSSKFLFVVAAHDQYVPREDEMSPAQIWPNVSLRYIDSGHVMGVVRYQQVFRDAIQSTIEDLTSQEWGAGG